MGGVKNSINTGPKVDKILLLLPLVNNSRGNRNCPICIWRFLQTCDTNYPSEKSLAISFVLTEEDFIVHLLFFQQSRHWKEVVANEFRQNHCELARICVSKVDEFVLLRVNWRRKLAASSTYKEK